MALCSPVTKIPRFSDEIAIGRILIVNLSGLLKMLSTDEKMVETASSSYRFHLLKRFQLNKIITFTYVILLPEKKMMKPFQLAS